MYERNGIKTVVWLRFRPTKHTMQLVCHSLGIPVLNRVHFVGMYTSYSIYAKSFVRALRRNPVTGKVS